MAMGLLTCATFRDVVVNVFAAYGYAAAEGRLYLLDGASGDVHWRSDVMVRGVTTPALGDIDGDGLPEIIALAYDEPFLVALEHDGTLKWRSNLYLGEVASDAIALADLDHDGDVEIMIRHQVLDHTGAWVATFPDKPSPSYEQFGHATVAADLDGDTDLEVVLGRSAYHHDGSPYFHNPGLAFGVPQIADFDGDQGPEVLLHNENGISLLQHDGEVVWSDLRPTGAPADIRHWQRPSAVHDFDGDKEVEFVVSSRSQLAVYGAHASVRWTASVTDLTGSATATAFDFLGDGVAEAIYGDELNLRVYDGQSGDVLLSVPRSSGTNIEYPVVVDVDGDASAELLIVSNEGWFTNQTSVTLQVVGDGQDRWIPTRRIWNQHTYHVTNVREDGVIPQWEQPHWLALNTFRTNAQIEAGEVCRPAS